MSPESFRFFTTDVAPGSRALDSSFDFYLTGYLLNSCDHKILWSQVNTGLG